MTMLFEPWKQFHHPAVRQLAFSIASPNILSSLPTELHLRHTFNLHCNDFWQQHYKNYQVRLFELDQNPEPLLAFLAQLKSTRLGLRFEYLMWFWLQDEAFHDLRLLGHSIQIIHGRHTLGELDFLLFNTTTQQIEHWEVALKYYLAEVSYDLQYWYGLNRTDTLQRKLNHFTEKQFQFETVSQHNIQKRYAVLKGQLFLPAHKTQDLNYAINNLIFNHPESKVSPINTTIPSWINPHRNIGQWGHFIPQQNYYRLQRQEWICHDAKISSPAAYWWTNGLYKSIKKEQFFMFRQPPFIRTNVEHL